jgi:membrane-bound lytic murein transglycosylase A
MAFVPRSAWLGACLFLGGCVTIPQVTPPVAVTPEVPPKNKLVKLAPEQVPAFDDDADLPSLRIAARQSLAYYRGRPPQETYTLATDTYTAVEFADSLAFFVDLIDRGLPREAWKEEIRKNFDVYQSIGTDAARTVTFSSYYEPVIPARLKRTDTFRYPIYGRPADLIDVDLGQFNPDYQGARISGRRKGQNLIPYHTRADIDSKHVLKGTTKVLAWAKTPTDIFFMQIEGSGWLDVGKGKKVRIRYNGTNGQKYRSVGTYLLNSGRYPAKTIDHWEFEAFLNNNPKERQGILNVNPRYVFFQLDYSTMSAFAFGNIQVPLTAWRSIATDPKIFPKGALTWIATDRPAFDEKGKKIGLKPLNRFMLNQDEGGAIQGPGRVDFFAGDGHEAEQFATHFWQKGTLYFLVKKKGT